MSCNISALFCITKYFYNNAHVFKSEPFNVGVGHRQGCVLSPLLFIVCMKLIDRCSRVDEYVTADTGRINRTFFCRRVGTTCIFLNRDFNMHLIGFLLRATKPEWKSALKRPRYYVSPESQGCICGNTLQHVVKFKYLGVGLTSDGRRNNEIEIC